MNFGEIDDEIKEYQTFFRQSELTMNKLSLFFKEFSKSGNKFIDKIQKSLDDFFTELQKEDNSTTLNINFTSFYNVYTKFLSNVKTYFNAIDQKLGENLINYEKEYHLKNNNSITELTKISNKLNESKAQLEKAKNNYFDACKYMREAEIKLSDCCKKAKSTGEEITKLTEKKIKARESLEEKKTLYATEVKSFNNLLNENETKYLGVIETFQKNQNDKILYFIDILNNFSIENKNSVDTKNNLITSINKYKDNINIRRDLKLFTHDFNHMNNTYKKRFINEHFLDYELLKKSESSAKRKSSTGEEFENEQNEKYTKAFQLLELGKDEFIDKESLNENDKILDSIFKKLISQESKISDDEHSNLRNYIDNNNEESIKRFMYIFVNHFCIKELVKIKNEDNFNYLNKILNDVLDFCYKNKDVFEIIYLVLFIAIKSVFINKNENNKILYLSTNLSKNPLLNSIDFWKELIDNRISLVAEVKIRDNLEKRKNTFSNKQNLLTDTVNTINKLGGKLGGTIGKFWGGLRGEDVSKDKEKDKDNKEIETEILFNQVYSKNVCNYCAQVIDYYIRQFIVFNFDNLAAEKLIDLKANKYKMSTNFSIYYKNLIISNQLYKTTLKKNNYILGNNDFDKYNSYYKGSRSFKKIDNPKVKCLLFSLKYLDIKEYPKILTLSKKYKTKISNTVYKNILLKYYNSLDIEKHLKIWKILIKYSDIKKKYNYAKILEDANKNEDKIKSFDVIKMDVIRTSFDTDEKIKREKIQNILKSIAFELPSLNYCQGMNSIAAFLLDICNNDEEETFYIFLCLLLDTKYTTLFQNNLEILNQLFYQFERILNNKMPGFYMYLKSNKITPGYFVSPWFITVFTNVYIDAKDLNNRKLVMRIFDLFIFSGWKAIIKIGIALLKYNECNILNLPFEDLLNYLTCEIIKSSFFGKDNLNEINKASFLFDITNALLSNIEKEFDMKKKLPKIEE